LNLGFTFSSLAATKLDAGNPASAERSMDSAEKAYQTVDRFLSDPKHSAGLTVDEIQDMREELQRLRDRLDAVAQRFKK
jgi:hypothetical protein